MKKEDCASIRAGSLYMVNTRSCCCHQRLNRYELCLKRCLMRRHPIIGCASDDRLGQGNFKMPEPNLVACNRLIACVCRLPFTRGTNSTLNPPSKDTFRSIDRLGSASVDPFSGFSTIVWRGRRKNKEEQRFWGTRRSARQGSGADR